MWSWSKLSAKKWEDAWAERIAGNPNSVITEVKGGKTVRITVYVESETDARTLQHHFGGSVRPVKTQNWVAEQARAKRPPLIIRDRLVVTDRVEPADLAALQAAYPNRRILSIPPEMAFGTGDHATTSTCLRLVCDFARAHRPGTWHLTDIGCGTGVLALAGIALGAAPSRAFDFDPAAVEVARANLARNGVPSDRLAVFQADVFAWEPGPGERADLVVANLFSTILQRAFPRLTGAMKPGGQLIVSGILRTQWEETLAAAERAGLHCARVITRGKWTTALLHGSPAA